MITEYSKNTVYRTFVFPIKRTKEIVNFVWRNSNHKRKIKNIFIEEFRDRDPRSIRFGEIDELAKIIFHREEKDGEYYFENKLAKGISRYVASEIKSSIKTMISKHKNGDGFGKFRFKKLDRYRCTFMVENKRVMNDEDSFSARFNITDKKSITYNLFRNESISFQLKEDIYTSVDRRSDGRHIYYNTNLGYKFRANDIKEVGFKYELGKVYLLLKVECNYEIYDILNKTNIAMGIDYGIHYPAVMYDGEYRLEYSRLIPQEAKDKIKYLENRIKILQSIMDRKTYGSKNYYKVLYKFRKSWSKIVGLKHYYNHLISKELVKYYFCICVDTFKINNTSYTKEVEGPFKRHINFKSRFHRMYKFNEMIKYKSDQYDTIYLDTDDYKYFNTTNRCSLCGNLNEKTLHLSERTFICEDCSYTEDRDMNAAKNCYNIAIKYLKDHKLYKPMKNIVNM